MPNKTIDTLTGLEEQMEEAVDIAIGGQPLKPDGTPITDPAELKQYNAETQQMGDKIKGLGDVIKEIGNQKKDMSEELTETLASTYFSIKDAQLNNLPDVARNEFTSTTQGGVSSQGGAGDLEEDILLENSNSEFSIENMHFSSASDVIDALEAIGNPEEASQQFFRRFGKDNGFTEDPDMPGRISADDDTIRDPINEFFSTNDKDVKEKIAEFLYTTVISEDAKEEDTVPPKEEGANDNSLNNTLSYIHPAIIKIVKYTENYIKKIAEEHHKNVPYNSSFNLVKEAQHKSFENVIMYGPSDKVDAFTGMPISDWHLVERNKGFGLKIEEIWNIDWEVLWRGYVMDKYSAPHKDKDGNWVGGYIQDRFEVDKYIPSYNNMQLAPGERRRATPPEYSHTEARLEAAREKGKPFNWAKEASSVQTVNKYAKNKRGQTASINIYASDNDLYEKGYKDGKDGEEMGFPDNDIYMCGYSEGVKSNREMYREHKETDEDIVENLSKKKVIQSNNSGIFSVKVKQPQRWCPYCGSKMRNALTPTDPTGATGRTKKFKGNPDECPNCHRIVINPLTSDPQMNRSNPGQSGSPVNIQNNQYIQQGVPLKATSGIFFDGKQFVCYKEGQKTLFDTFEDAENYNKDDEELWEKPVDMINEEQEEILSTMDNLAIDG